jgi:hypothetical protein
VTRARHTPRAPALARWSAIVWLGVSCVCLPARAFAQSAHLLIVVGLPGDPEHGELFTKWGTTLSETAVQKLGVPKENVLLLSGAAATREAVGKAFATLASRAGVDDTAMVVLIGFGTFDGKVAKFNLPGPDMVPEDFVPLLDRIKARRLIFVDTTSASGPFVPVLSKLGRVVVAAW